MSDARTRFAELTEQQTATPLAGAFAIRCVTAEEWKSVAADIIAAALPREYTIDANNTFSTDEMAAMRDLDDGMTPDALRHHFLFEHDGEVVGVYGGFQDTRARYYMMFSAVKPAFQGRGLYKDLLGRLIAIADGTGFREIYSRHHADNNQVLVPKLQRGFVIAGFEVSPKYGLIIELRKYLCEGQQRLHRYRVDASLEYPGLARDGIVKS